MKQIGEIKKIYEKNWQREIYQINWKIWRNKLYIQIKKTRVTFFFKKNLYAKNKKKKKNTRRSSLLPPGRAPEARFPQPPPPRLPGKPAAAAPPSEARRSRRAIPRLRATPLCRAAPWGVEPDAAPHLHAASLPRSSPDGGSACRDLEERKGDLEESKGERRQERETAREKRRGKGEGRHNHVGPRRRPWGGVHPVNRKNSITFPGACVWIIGRV